MMLYCRVHECAWVPPGNLSAPRSLSSRLLASDAARPLTYALAWAKSGGCEGQITIIETACDRCQRKGSNTHRDARRLAWWHPVGLVPSLIRSSSFREESYQ